MALSDYYLCDNCECKTFYDGDLQYGNKENPDTGHPWPDGNIGHMQVLCEDCAKLPTRLSKTKERLERAENKVAHLCESWDKWCEMVCVELLGMNPDYYGGTCKATRFIECKIKELQSTTPTNKQGE